MEELVKKAKNGDKESFTELMLQMNGELYRIAKIRLKSDDDIFDAIQETMILAYKSLKKLKYNQYFKTWIIRILINECNKLYIIKKKRNENSYEILDNEIANTDDTEDKINFDFICSKLKHEDATIIILYYMERYTDKEIAEILNKNENTIRTKRTRAKEKLRNIYNDKFGRC